MAKFIFVALLAMLTVTSLVYGQEVAALAHFSDENKVDDVDAATNSLQCAIACGGNTDNSCGRGGFCAAGCCKSLCLHGDNVVRTKSGEKYVKDLALSDHVLVVNQDGVVKYQPMYLDIHRNVKRDAVFIEILTENYHKLKVTPTHMIYKGNSLFASQLVPAESVAVGDPVQVYESARQYLRAERVVNVSKLLDVGIYNPLVHSGRMIVGDVLTSNYPDFPPFTPQQTHYSLWTVRQAYYFLHNLYVTSKIDENPEFISFLTEKAILIYDKILRHYF